LGVTIGDRWKVDGSVFTGREPDEHRFNIDPIKLDSVSGRVEHNPSPNWSLSAAYGFLREPEELEPGIDQNRITTGIQYSAPVRADNLSVGLFYGRNVKRRHDATDSFNLEATYSGAFGSVFSRLEQVDKDELVDVPPGTYRIHKLTLGMVRNFLVRDGFEWGLGGFVGFHRFPAELEPFYGRNPVSLGIFLRVRPERMRH
jgi:hypothetical protein